MEISYQLTEKDFLDFNIHHAKNSSHIQKSILIQRISGPIIFLIAPFFATKQSGITIWYWFVLFGIVSIIWFIFYPKYIYWEISRKTMKIIKEGENKNILGEKTIVLTSENIIETGLSNEEKIKLNSIQKIEETEDHLFIYISSMSAFIIPLRAFEDSKSKDEFIKKIKEQII